MLPEVKRLLPSPLDRCVKTGDRRYAATGIATIWNVTLRSIGLPVLRRNHPKLVGRPGIGHEIDDNRARAERMRSRPSCWTESDRVRRNLRR